MGNIIKFPEQVRELVLYRRPELEDEEVFAYTANSNDEIIGVECLDNALTLEVTPDGQYAVYNGDDESIGGFLFNDLERMQSCLFAFLLLTGYFGDDFKIGADDGADSSTEES